MLPEDAGDLAKTYHDGDNILVNWVQLTVWGSYNFKDTNYWHIVVKATFD